LVRFRGNVRPLYRQAENFPEGERAEPDQFRIKVSGELSCGARDVYRSSGEKKTFSAIVSGLHFDGV